MDSSSLSSLSSGSSGMASGRGAEPGHRREGLLLLPAEPGERGRGQRFHVTPSDPCECVCVCGGRGPGSPGPAPSSSEEMANRGISMMAEQQRRRTVRGGLESLSVGEDSLTERRFLRLRGAEQQEEQYHTWSAMALHTLSQPTGRRRQLTSLASQ